MPRNSLYRQVFDARQADKAVPQDNSHMEIETPQIVPPKGTVKPTPKNPSGYPVQPVGRQTETS
jgi:hypothetical protein